MMKDRIALALAGLTLAVHMAFANRYDLFRDELYFIVCGQHPAFGYADQPPLVPLVAAAGYALGAQTWLVRFPSALAAAALVWLAIAFARLLGGRNGAAWLAGIVAAVAPILLGLTATLNTTSFEPLAWTAVAYALARAAILDDRRALIAAGFIAGLALEAKYALPLWLAALGVGLLATKERRILAYRELWVGLAIAVAIAAPSIVWQAAHGWPFVTLIGNAGLKDAAVRPLAYMLNQIFIVNPLAAPLWIAGLIAPFAVAELRAARFLPIAYVLAAAATIAGGGKDYYLAPAYPALFAIGAVALERAVRNGVIRTVYAAAIVALSAVIAPLALPILPPAAVVAYERALHLAPQQQERGDAATVLPSTFADMLGWHDFVREVAAAYDTIPLADRPATSILVDNYGEAAAIDLYGPSFALPPALSGHNQYGLWGTRGQTPRNILRVQNNPEQLRPYCAQMRVITTTSSTYARAFENGKSIAYCRGIHPSLAQLWPDLKFLI
jgi:4-amino-4-deoxy-L-arabinose transferase-like glycosyltransferase